MPAAEPTAVELGDYLGIIRRRYLVVGVSVLVCLVIGLFMGLRQPDVYRSTAEIALPSPDSAQTPNQATADVQTELAVIQSDVVATRAADAIGDEGDPRDLLAKLAVEAPPEARVLVIVYQAATAEAAQAGAQAFADGYIELKEDEQRQAIADEVAAYDDQIAAVEEGIAEQEAKLNTLDEDSREYARAEDARDRLADTLTELQADRTTVEATRVDGGTIITPARLPRQPKSQGFGRTIATSIAAGLVLGLGLAFVLDRLDTRVRGAADLEKSLGVRTLGTIPVFPERFRQPPNSLVVVHEPDGGSADAFRRLRTSVLLALDTAGAHTIAITSATANEGKSTVAANLAVAATQANRRVLLVAADVYKMGVEALLETSEAPGLSDLLLDKVTLDDALRDVGELTVLTRGTPLAYRGVQTSTDPSSPTGFQSLPGSFEGKDFTSATDFLDNTLTRDVIEAIRQGKGHGAAEQPFDLIVFDTPPVIEAADVLVLAPRLDATLLVVSPEQAKSSSVADALAELERSGVSVIGAVINNDPDASKRASGAAAYAARQA